MSWIVDRRVTRSKHQCDLPANGGPALQIREVGSIWECDRCYAQYELKILNVAGHNKKVMVRK